MSFEPHSPSRLLARESSRRIRLLLVAMVSLAGLACGQQPGLPPGAMTLEGTWWGNWLDAASGINEVVVHFDSSERLFALTLDGAAPGLTATTDPLGDGRYQVFVSDGRSAIAYLDPSGQYLALIIDGGDSVQTIYAALQRGTPVVRGRYGQVDYQARWIGQRLPVDNAFRSAGIVSSDTEVFAGGDVRGVSGSLAFTDERTIFGEQLRYIDFDHGVLQGGYSEGAFQPGLMLMVIAPDAQFAVFMGFPGSAPYPTALRIHAWRRQ